FLRKHGYPSTRGGAAAGAPADPVAALKTLKDLLDNGLITQAEYDAKKAEILKRL
ncbi:MAG: SHOCT domain-containing protein, partial [Chloroflexi bacterium]|nr:SHOCT domain-containing protein [Chloroflexota bacterium]